MFMARTIPYTRLHMNTLSLKTFLSVLGILIGLQIGILTLFGQPAFCACGEVKLWEGVVSSPGNSQQISDWYTPSHIIHGFLFFALFSLFLPRASIATRFLLAVFLEVSWEIIENTPMVIDHYRKQALAQGYVGDSILNSVSDTLAMAAGFLAARRLPLWLAISIVIALEGVVMYFIRDGLLLNIINLFYPLEFIAQWQMAG
jgi:hypothetical protein